MRKIFFAAALVLGVAAYLHAQTAAVLSLTLILSADTVTRAPVNGYDGIVRPGKAEFITTAMGNVVIFINGTRVTADSATWHSGLNVIELASGRVRIELPGEPTTTRVEERR